VRDVGLKALGMALGCPLSPPPPRAGHENTISQSSGTRFETHTTQQAPRLWLQQPRPLISKEI